MFERQELQTINRRFELRQWLIWSGESLRRLNPVAIIDYHEKHEQPKEWYAWDFTLSWLLENNHPRICNKVLIFNRMVEDEPPKEALKDFPWMEALLNNPLRRKTVAEMVELLARSGAAAVVLDNDFPQYSADDALLAKVIHNASCGVYGKATPVFMVRAINRFSNPRLLAIEAPSAPVGVLDELQKLEPGVDVTEKYTGMTCILPDSDQVVRRAEMRVVNPATGRKRDSVVLKVLRALKQEQNPGPPDVMDIDFAAFPNSDLFPVRPLSYLLDPQQKERFLNRQSALSEPNLDGAVVFLGDSISDVYNTPLTNEIENQMSGTEILANALDTVSRRSWPRRLPPAAAFVYMILASLAGGALWGLWKELQQKTESFRGGAQCEAGGSVYRLATDTLFFCTVSGTALAAACFIFSYTGWIVPVFVPSISLAVGALSAIVWEREGEREKSFLEQIKSQQEKHELEIEKVEAEMAKKEVEAENREMYQDRKRRQEFVRRINHDLNAPVSVLNWTISELQLMDINNADAREKIKRLVKSSDKLCELIDQLVKSYDYETSPNIANNQAAICDLAQVLDDCIDSQRTLAEKFDDSLHWVRPEESLWVNANSLELSRVLDNIIRNAIKHNPPETGVSIEVEGGTAFHEISISDNGKGIAPEHLSRIFEPGYRVNPEKRDGQGLGLDIAKSLIESMGGQISVSSIPGEGTKFKLKFPSCAESRDCREYLLAEEELEGGEVQADKETLKVANKGTGD